MKNKNENARLLVKSEIPGAKLFKRGKTKDIYKVAMTGYCGKGKPEELLLIVATDRISAFDRVLPSVIPGKGKFLNQLTIFWMDKLRNIVPNHIYSSDDDYCLAHIREDSYWSGEELKGRVILVKKAEVIPIVCIVRGYLCGSLWTEYCRHREQSGRSTVFPLGHELPIDLKESEELPRPIFTPSTKAEKGHDENLAYKGMVQYLRTWLFKHPEIRQVVNAEVLAQTLRSTSIALYLAAQKYALKWRIIIADTKFEFGFIDGQLTLIDEVLTPDSSRFWEWETYEPGKPQKSLDKQFVRDWLTKEAEWNGEPPAPELPELVVEETSKKYQEIFKRLTK